MREAARLQSRLGVPLGAGPAAFWGRVSPLLRSHLFRGKASPRLLILGGPLLVDPARQKGLRGLCVSQLPPNPSAPPAATRGRAPVFPPRPGAVLCGGARRRPSPASQPTRLTPLGRYLDFVQLQNAAPASARTEDGTRVSGLHAVSSETRCQGVGVRAGAVRLPASSCCTSPHVYLYLLRDMSSCCPGPRRRQPRWPRRPRCR